MELFFKNRPAKGQRGYISCMKRHYLVFSLLILLFAAGLFILGLLLNNYNKGNIFTIIAAVMVLPMARTATLFVLFFPFRDADDETCELVAKTAKSGSLIYTDVVVTSTEKAMGFASVVVTGSKVIVLTGREKEDPFKAQEYLADLVRRRGFDYKVTVTEDRQRFLTLLRNSDSVEALEFTTDAEREAFETERAELRSTLESIMA